MTSKSKHTGLGVALGAVAGVMAGHVAIRLGIGIAIGMALGASFRREEAKCPECAVIHRRHEASDRQLESQCAVAGAVRGRDALQGRRRD
jgi:hypothetical protein